MQGSRKSHASDEQHEQHDEREGSSEIGGLGKKKQRVEINKSIRLNIEPTQTD